MNQINTGHSRYYYLFLLFTLIFNISSVIASEHDTNGRDFAGLKFGVGLSLSVDTGKRNRIKNAEIVDDIVSVTKENNNIARIMLESHFFFTPKSSTSVDGSLFAIKQGNWGIGPFVTVQPGTDEIIEAIGAGIMIGFKRSGENSNSWNFGLGIVVDPNVQVLGDGFNENESLPGSETQVRFKETSQSGLLIMTSFSF